MTDKTEQSDGQTADPRNRSYHSETGEVQDSSPEEHDSTPGKESNNTRGPGTTNIPGEGTANMGPGTGGIGGDDEGKDGTPKRGV